MVEKTYKLMYVPILQKKNIDFAQEPLVITNGLLYKEMSL